MILKKCEREHCGAEFLTKRKEQRFCSKKCRMEARSEQVNDKGQICWICKKATGKCSWSKYFQPVEGWIAEPIIVKDKEGNFRSYKIISCPLFVKGRV